MPLFGHSQCRLQWPTEQARCQPQNHMLVAVWLSGCLLPPSLAREGKTGVCGRPHSHPQVLTSPMPLGPASVLMQAWGSLLGLYYILGRRYRGNLGEHLTGSRWSQSPATFTLPTASQAQDPSCLCRTFRLLPPSPSPSLPFWPGPLHTLSPCLVSLYGSLYTPGPYPCKVPPFDLPCCCIGSLNPHCVPGPILRTYIESLVTSSPGEGQCQPPFTDGETKAREANDCPRLLHEMRVQIL